MNRADDHLLNALREVDAREELFARGETLVVGVSGGADSVALLDLLREYRAEKALKLHVAHLDHMLRDAAVDDAAWVAQLTADWEIPSSVDARDVARTAARLGSGVEDAARRVRYAYLAAEAARLGARSVVVAHHADDQVETLLMNFLRGSGLEGLRGMRAVSPYPLEAETILALEDIRRPGPGAPPWPPRLLRPLLEVSREAIEGYLRERGIQAREDESNRDKSFLRNRLRHELIPTLEAINPRLAETLLRNARAVAIDLDFVEEMVDRAWAEVAEEGAGGQVRFGLEDWARLAPAIQQRLLRRAVARLGGQMRDLGLEHVEALRERIEAGQGGASLPGGLRMLLGESHFEIAAGKPALPPLGGPEGGVPLLATGATRWPGGWRFRSELRERLPSDLGSGRQVWRAVIDADALGDEPRIRARRPGDRMQPAGMGGHHKSLQDLFVDGRVPQHLRAGWPILVAGERVAWVPGLRIDERARLRPATRRIYVIEVDAPEEAREVLG